MSEPPTVHVFEPNGLGHRPFFLAWLLADPPAERRWILHTTADVRAHPAVAAVLQHPPSHVTVVELRHCPAEPQRKSLSTLAHYIVAKALAYRRNWRRYAKVGDTAFFPSYDELAVIWGCLPWLTHGMPFTTIGMRAQFHQQRQGVVTSTRQRGHALKEFLLRRVLSRRSAQIYLTNQRPLKHDVDQRWGRLAHKVRFYPDPGATPVPVPVAEARQRLGLPADQALVLCYGSLTNRKGVDHLLAAMAHPSWPANTGAVCAGRYREGVRTLLSSPQAEALATQGRLHRREGYITNDDENLLFQACTAVWLVYDDHDAMSGCLVQAGLHQRAVIGCANGLIGWYIAQSNGGIIYRPAQITTSLAALAALLADPVQRAQAGQRLHACFKDHTMAMFRACVYAAILGRSEPHRWR